MLGPSAARADRQLAMPFRADEDRDRPRREVLPAVVHEPDWLDLDAQRHLISDFRQWARPPAGLRHPGCRPAI